MLAQSIRRPYVEMILRGIKTIEYRSTQTRRIDERFYLYASQTPGRADVFAELDVEPGDLPTDVILCSAKITHYTPPTRQMPYWHWHLVDVKRLKRPCKQKGRPGPVWFDPFPGA